jgi:hypothetical protein
MAIELTEALLMKAAGWDVVKLARAYLAQGQVLSSHWSPPLLRGVVQSDGVSIRASMAIQSDIDIENLCTCREARAWGKICAHGVAVGLHWLHKQKPKAAGPGKSTAGGASVPASRFVRSLAARPGHRARQNHARLRSEMEWRALSVERLAQGTIVRLLAAG